ncbi:MAG: flagellar hook-basal body complex protein [Hahellaceae bacterium]|nr:flagellar hook-basal body complex protein [Hahellaceae bacterium]
MTFNVALSGIKASSIDLEVSGNNIANASTVGFKRSRTEFGDLYANSFLNSGSNAVGDGVQVQKVRQLHTQGNISFTDSALDLAINGSGYFIANDGGQTMYTRAGQFGIQKDGFLVNNSDWHIQGFLADDEGVVGGILSDIQVDTNNLAPSRTTAVDPELNLDSRSEVLEERGVSLEADGPRSGQIAAGLVNSLPSETWTVTYGDGTSASVTTNAGDSAGAIAARISTALDGVDASATTTSSITRGNFNPANGDTLTVNGITFSSDTLSELAVDINSSALGGITAVLTGDPNAPVGASNELTLNIIHNQGGNLQFVFADGGTGTGSVQIDGSSNPASSQTLSVGNLTATVGGTVNIITEEGSTMSATTTDIMQTFTGVAFRNNVFDPNDPGTYNHATSSTIYDSLGNNHVLSMYFVKQASTTTIQPNTWQMHVLIDGADVGDPVAGVGATRASFTLIFDENGTLNENLSDQPLISNWVPLDAQGNLNGADGPINIADGGTIPVPIPPTSSNFVIDMKPTTQYSSAFTVSDMRQDGYTTGRLTGLEVSDAGFLFARYTNGESRTLAQIALANFNDVEGLSPVGDTAWTQTFRSGDPIVGAPGTGTLGSLESSSIEESNVDLSEQLVNLIIAQRNYQANAKTIETADQVTQTILNI